MSPSSHRADIELSVPADRASLPVVRAVAAECAMRAHADDDYVTDVRFAVDEIFTSLLPHVRADRDIRCRFRLLDGHIRLRVRAQAGDHRPPHPDALGARMLQSVAQSVSTVSILAADGSQTLQSDVVMAWSQDGR